MNQNEIWEISKAILLSIGGAGLLLFGLASFLGKLWAERILGKEKYAIDKELASIQLKSSELITCLQATLDRAQHANRATFDHEFSTYKEIWGKVVDLRAAALSLRPMMDFIDPNQSEDDRKMERLTRFHNSIAPFWQTYEKNRPFLPEQIYNELSELVDLTHKEEAQYRFTSPKEDVLKYWDQSKSAREKIVASSDRICNLIRKRLEAFLLIPV